MRLSRPFDPNTYGATMIDQMMGRAGKRWYDMTEAEREMARQSHLHAVEAEERRRAERGRVDSKPGDACSSWCGYCGGCT